MQTGTSRQLKDTRLVALTLENKQEDRFIKVSELALSDRQVVRGWLKGFDKKKTFESVVLYELGRQHGHVEPDLQRSLLRRHTGRDDCEKQWKVEAFHKSLKFNATLAKSPTRSVSTQNNHVFMSIYTLFKL